MTKQEAQNLIGVHLDELATLCKDPEVLAEVISIVWNKGFQAGQSAAHLSYNQMFRHYDKTTLEN